MNEHPLKDGNKRREKRRGGERERKAKEKSGEGEYSQVRCTAPPGTLSSSTVAVPKVPGTSDTAPLDLRILVFLCSVLYRSIYLYLKYYSGGG